jgi:alpha-beta hydrolase superfamily lysophospholipase
VTAENTANLATPNTIVLIHGLWMTPLSWEHWKDRYEARGLRVLTPAWPGMDGDIDELRRDPSGIGHLGIREIVDHYAAIIRELARPNAELAAPAILPE